AALGEIAPGTVWRPPAARPRALSRLTGLAAVALLGSASVSGCGGGADEDAPPTIEREAFVATYTDLRLATLRAAGVPDANRRDAILQEHGVTEEELVEFAEVHGRDADFMRDVWDEVEQRLQEARLMSRGEGVGSDDEDDEGGGGAGDP
ncbi:MAG TPA: hypothetical protein VLL48_01500, partial [Longimicrobiales bacterium]|nr:hypothetical protein [Longimicrobiales bacterium]